MNKKEIAEIQKQFKPDNDLFVINRVATCCVTRRSEILYKSVRKFAGFAADSKKDYIPTLECDQYLDIFKKTLSGSIGKSLIEFEFPYEQEQNNGAQVKLYNLLKDGFKDEDMVNDYIQYIIDNYDEPSDYTIIMAHCTYSVPNKNDNDEHDEVDDTEVFNFILASICPMGLGDMCLFYNEDEKELTHKPNTEKIAKPPIAGFMFPTFDDRAADVNHVLYFSKNAKEPIKKIVEDVLGCTFGLTSEDEKTIFNNLLTKVAATSKGTAAPAVPYEVAQNVHSQITDIVLKSSAESETPKLTKTQIKKIFQESGVDEDKLENFDETYKSIVGDTMELKAVNVIDTSKMGIKSPDVVVNVKSTKSDKVSAQIINGKKCLVICLDEDVEINGLNVKV